MKRNYIIELLKKYVSCYEEEIKFKDEMLFFIQKHENCFDRSLDEGHITASAWLINKDNSKALLMHHAKLNSWFQLGGHCDGESNVLAVAIKEVQEESGIKNIESVQSEIFDIDIHIIPENSKQKAHFHYDVRFLLRVFSDEKIQKNHESKELRWIGKNIQELPTNTPSIIRMHTKWVDKGAII